MLNYSVLHEHLQGGMRRYIEDGIPPGSFLQACLANDLTEAVGHASSQTWEYIHSVVMFLWNELPGRGYSESPWGSREAIERHVERMRDMRVGKETIK